MAEYTEHLKIRLKLRRIPEDYPNKIYTAPEKKYYDSVENTFIAIKTLYYKGKKRNMMIAYQRKGKTDRIITIHPITDEKILNRIISRRWLEDE